MITIDRNGVFTFAKNLADKVKVELFNAILNGGEIEGMLRLQIAYSLGISPESVMLDGEDAVCEDMCNCDFVRNYGEYFDESVGERFNGWAIANVADFKESHLYEDLHGLLLEYNPRITCLVVQDFEGDQYLHVILPLRNGQPQLFITRVSNNARYSFTVNEGDVQKGIIADCIGTSIVPAIYLPYATYKYLTEAAH